MDLKLNYLEFHYTYRRVVYTRNGLIELDGGYVECVEAGYCGTLLINLQYLFIATQSERTSEDKTCLKAFTTTKRQKNK